MAQCAAGHAIKGQVSGERTLPNLPQPPLLLLDRTPTEADVRRPRSNRGPGCPPAECSITPPSRASARESQPPQAAAEQRKGWRHQQPPPESNHAIQEPRTRTSPTRVIAPNSTCMKPRSHSTLTQSNAKQLQNTERPPPGLASHCEGLTTQEEETFPMADQQLNAPPCAQSQVPADVPPSGIRHINRRHADRFTVVGNHLVQHRQLSLTAIGLAAHIQSLPPGASVTIKTLAARFPEGEVRIAAALRELESHGYLTRTRERLASGRVITRTTSYNNPPAMTATPAPPHEPRPTPRTPARQPPPPRPRPHLRAQPQRSSQTYAATTHASYSQLATSPAWRPR